MPVRHTGEPSCTLATRALESLFKLLPLLGTFSLSLLSLNCLAETCVVLETQEKGLSHHFPLFLYFFLDTTVEAIFSPPLVQGFALGLMIQSQDSDYDSCDVRRKALMCTFPPELSPVS